MIFRGYCFTGMYYKSMTIVVIERCLAVMDDGTRSEEPERSRKSERSARYVFLSSFSFYLCMGILEVLSQIFLFCDEFSGAK